MSGGHRPAPLVLMGAPAADEAPFGSYAAVLATGRHLLAAELSQRLARQGAAVQLIPPSGEGLFHWGSWYARAARAAPHEAGDRADALGRVGAGVAGRSARVDAAALQAIPSAGGTTTQLGRATPGGTSVGRRPERRDDRSVVRPAGRDCAA